LPPNLVRQHPFDQWANSRVDAVSDEQSHFHRYKQWADSLVDNFLVELGKLVVPVGLL